MWSAETDLFTSATGRVIWLLRRTPPARTPATERREMLPGRGAGCTLPTLAGDATRAPSCAEPLAAHFGGGGSGAMIVGVCKPQQGAGQVCLRPGRLHGPHEALKPRFIRGCHGLPDRVLSD